MPFFQRWKKMKTKVNLNELDFKAKKLFRYIFPVVSFWQYLINKLGRTEILTVCTDFGTINRS